MANKTIYVRDEDLPTYERAEELGKDSLSAVIAEALRRYIAAEEARAEGMEEHVLEVGRWGDQQDDVRKIKLVGRVLATHTHLTGQVSDKRDRGTDYAIYQTRKGQIVVHWTRWTRWDNEGSIADYAVTDRLPRYDQAVIGQNYGTVLGQLPGSLIEEAAEALAEAVIEVIE